MAKRNSGHNGSPPIKKVDWKLFEQLCSILCTQEEIASMLHLEPDTLRKKVKEYYKLDYSAVYKIFSSKGKCSLRRYQFMQSKTKPNMAIWLGKQWLDQKDEPRELAEFNGKLGELLAKLGSVESEKEFKEAENESGERTTNIPGEEF